jgi:hypothetical protein
MGPLAGHIQPQRPSGIGARIGRSWGQGRGRGRAAREVIVRDRSNGKSSTCPLATNGPRFGRDHFLLSTARRNWALFIRDRPLTLLGVNPIRLLVLVAVINGIAAGPFLVLLMLIASDSTIMGKYVNGRLARAVGWATAAIMAVAAFVLFTFAGGGGLY